MIKLFLIFQLFLLFPIYKSLSNKDIDNKKLVKLFLNKKINSKFLYKRCIDTLFNINNLNQTYFKYESFCKQRTLQDPLSKQALKGCNKNKKNFNLFCEFSQEIESSLDKSNRDICYKTESNNKKDYKIQNLDKFNNLRGYIIKQSHEHFENKNYISNYLNIFNYFSKKLNNNKSKNLRGTNIVYNNENDNTNKLSLYYDVLKIFYYI